MSAPADPVPCNGCTLCCREEPVQLLPEQGDDYRQYRTVAGRGIGGRPALFLKQEAGACVYLNETGCSIYEKRPFLCRDFDCRVLYQQSPRPERRRRIKATPSLGPIYARGRELLEGE